MYVKLMGLSMQSGPHHCGLLFPSSARVLFPSPGRCPMPGAGAALVPLAASLLAGVMGQDRLPAPVFLSCHGAATPGLRIAKLPCTCVLDRFFFSV